MADLKKPAPKPRPKPFETVLTLVIIALIISAISQRIPLLFSQFQTSGIEQSVSGFFSRHVWPVLKLFSYAISAAAVVGSVYAVKALTAVTVAQNAYFSAVPVEEDTSDVAMKNRRWEKVLAHLSSPSPSDWKFAILEADIILDELLDATGYRGETVSDKLKRVEVGQFRSLEGAWEAHKVRNSIAHEGSDFVVTEREAKRVIDLYRDTFEEFHFI
jgi:hypothetical protein